MAWFLDESERKVEKHKGRTIILYRCGCALCEKCWFSPDSGHCIYGGPFTGFERVNPHRA